MHFQNNLDLDIYQSGKIPNASFNESPRHGILDEEDMRTLPSCTCPNMSTSIIHIRPCTHTRVSLE